MALWEGGNWAAQFQTGPCTAWPVFGPAQIESAQFQTGPIGDFEWWAGQTGPGNFGLK